MPLLFVEVRDLIRANESFYGTFVGVKLMRGLSAMIEPSLVSVVVLALWFMEMSKSLERHNEQDRNNHHTIQSRQ